MSRQIAMHSTADLASLEQRIHALEHQVAVLAEKVRELTPEADETENGHSPEPAKTRL